MRVLSAWIFILSALVLTVGIRADTRLDVKVGWDDAVIQGCWTPIVVTVSDTRPRNARLQIESSHSANTAMKVTQIIALSTMDQTYITYLPIQNDYRGLKITLHDSSTGKLLAEMDRNSTNLQQLNYVDKQRTQFLLVTGIGAAFKQIHNFNSAVHSVFLRTAMMPRTSRGFDGISTVALNSPNLSLFEQDQITALLDWVRAGGHLVMWPGSDPLPANGMLIDALPATIGPVSSVTLDKNQKFKAGLTQRMGAIRSRQLTAKPGTSQISLLGTTESDAIVGHYGLGKIVLIPFDAATLDFDNDPLRIKWDQALNLQANTSPPEDGDFGSAHNDTASALIDTLGNVPGVGAFGFKYVAIVLIALMFIVGPIDWFVLKKLGRQPLTWVTTTGWIALVTLGAIYIGYLFKSGDLHYRTVRLVDQADDVAVARTNYLGIYSPQNDEYNLKYADGNWVEPMGISSYSSNGIANVIDFAQDGTQNIPAPMSIRVWNLRFMQSQIIQKSKPLLIAKLHATSGTNQLAGSITNTGTDNLKEIWVQTKAGTAKLNDLPNFPAGGLAAGASINISTTQLTFRNEFLFDQPVSNHDDSNYRYGRYRPPSTSQTTSVDPASHPLYAIAANTVLLNHDKKDRQAATDSDHAIVYAISDTASPEVILEQHHPLEKHWLVIRAVVPIGK